MPLIYSVSKRKVDVSLCLLIAVNYGSRIQLKSLKDAFYFICSLNYYNCVYQEQTDASSPVIIYTFIEIQPLTNLYDLPDPQEVSTNAPRSTYRYASNGFSVLCPFAERMETANKQLATRDCEGTEDNRKTISQLLTQSMEN